MNYKKLKALLPILSIFIGSVALTFVLNISGAFGFLELKLYDGTEVNRLIPSICYLCIKINYIERSDKGFPLW